MTTEAAIAREAIRHTMSVYNNGDRGDFDALVSAFSADATLEAFGVRHRGHAEIRAFAKSAASGRPILRWPVAAV